MEEVSSQEHHVNISVFGQTHNFVEALPAVVTSNGICLREANMIVGRYQDPDGVCSWKTRHLWGSPFRCRRLWRRLLEDQGKGGRASHPKFFVSQRETWETRLAPTQSGLAQLECHPTYLDLNPSSHTSRLSASGVIQWLLLSS